MIQLTEKQQHFAMAISGLIVYANNICLPVVLGEAALDQNLHGAFGEQKGDTDRHSLHKLRLACDLHIVVDGKPAMPDTYDPLHEYWEAHGYGRRIPGMPTHFSFEHEGWR
ncbi:MAG: M15 family peptidase [Gammaproteobacteria bacterium]